MNGHQHGGTAACIAPRVAQLERLLQRAEAIAHIGHWSVSLDPPAASWSEEVYRIFGWPPDGAPTLATVTECCHPEDHAALCDLFRRTLETREAFVVDLRIVRADGAIRHLTCRGEAEIGQDGATTGIGGTFHDVTESHEIVAQLRHRQKLDAIGQLAAGVAHDFNNILQGVLGGIELILADTGMAAESRSSAEMALNSAERGAALTHQLLSFARKQMLVPQRVDIAAFIADLRELLVRTLGPHIHIETAAAEALPPVRVDPDQLHTALLNLAINAGQAMPRGGELQIVASSDVARGEAHGSVVIAVRDTGRGMDAATLLRCTEPFFTTKGPGGTGLGLPMVQGFARQSGGDLRMFSEPGRGTTAEIVLPTDGEQRP